MFSRMFTYTLANIYYQDAVFTFLKIVRGYDTMEDTFVKM